MSPVNPFFTQIKFETRLTPSEYLDRLNCLVRRPELSSSYLQSLHPKGQFIGGGSDGRFEVHEAMGGFGGASGHGTVIPAPGGASVQITVCSGLYLRYAFVISDIAYLLVVAVYLSTFKHDGFSIGRFLAMAVYTALFAMTWWLTQRDMRAIKSFIVEIVSE